MRIVYLALILATFGCATPVQHVQRFVVIRNVPLEPTFTVLPANRTSAEIAFANAVELAIVQANGRVLSPPHTAFVIEEHSLKADEIESKMQGKSELSGESTRTLQYWAYDDLDATYVVNTIKWGNYNGQIKIENRKTREVLTVFTVRDEETFAPTIRTAIGALLGRSNDDGLST